MIRNTGCPWPSGIHAFKNGVCTRCGAPTPEPEPTPTPTFNLVITYLNSAGEEHTMDWGRNLSALDAVASIATYISRHTDPDTDLPASVRSTFVSAAIVVNL